MKLHVLPALLLELIFICAMTGLLWVLCSIPFAKAGPFSFIIIGALGFSLICILQGYVHYIGKLELPLGTYVISLFVKKYNPRALQKISLHSRNTFQNRR
jgi:hypothetical protein